jgi:tetratricopeptide (TPR) repeat protein
LEQSPHVQLAPFIRYSINHKKALVYISQGNIQAAEKLLMENLENYNNLLEPYIELYNMYIGHKFWDKAERLEGTMKKRFPSLFGNLNAREIKKRFESFTSEQKMSFYRRFKNFGKAIELMEEKPEVNLSHQLLLAELFYKQGKEKEGEDIILEIEKENPEDFRILNAIGNLYIKEFFRENEALVYFQKSLKINPNQPELAHLVKRLRERKKKSGSP